jgi:lipopolysaccharide/colanic/teichoic acid biosynthesis glycosyltransferase
MQKTSSKSANDKQPGWFFLILSILAACLYLLVVQKGIWGLSSLSAAIFAAFLSKFTTGILAKSRAYKLALVFSLILSAGGWMVVRLSGSAQAGAGYFFLSFGAGFVSAIALSWFEDGFWDDTFVPSSELTAQIEELYRTHNDERPRLLVGKRIFDIILALLGMILSLPLWVLISLLVWLQDPGPILFVKHCTGYRGKAFRLYKFRTMPVNAEEETGPIVSGESDQRVDGICRLLRKTALDELPQLVSILKGDMSFVGPRPLRSVVEIENIRVIPGYARRFNTPPGLAGLAQICGSNLTPPRDKLRYETIYARHAGVLFDIKLIAIAFLLVFYLRWTKNWDGRVPRDWVRFGSKPR